MIERVVLVAGNFTNRSHGKSGKKAEVFQKMNIVLLISCLFGRVRRKHQVLFQLRGGLEFLVQIKGPRQRVGFIEVIHLRLVLQGVQHLSTPNTQYHALRYLGGFIR